MQTSDETAPPRRRLWLRILLIASLALNLLVAGVAIGAMLRAGAERQARQSVDGSVGSALVRALPKEDRRVLWRTLRRSAPANAGRQVEDAAAVAAVLRSNPFDAAAMTALMAAAATQRTDWLASVQDAWLQRVSQMSDVERAAYADRLEKVLNDPRRRKGRPRLD